VVSRCSVKCQGGREKGAREVSCMTEGEKGEIGKSAVISRKNLFIAYTPEASVSCRM